jgi:hypothetical protein
MLETALSYLINLREFFLNMPILDQDRLDNFCNIKMNPIVKRYLRLFDLFAQVNYFKNLENKEEFMQKYIYIYPTHLNFEEKYVIIEETKYLQYFLRIPSVKKRIIKWNTIS